MKRILLGWVRTIVVLGLFITFPGNTTISRAAAPTTNLFSSAAFVLDGVRLNLIAPWIPGRFTTSSPEDSIQMATSARLGKGYREISLTVAPYGSRPPTEGLEAARPGISSSWRSTLRNTHQHQQETIRTAPVISFFGQRVPGTLSIVRAQVNGLKPAPVLMAEWVAEAGGRVWILRVGQVYDGENTIGQKVIALSHLRLSSPRVSLPSPSAAARLKQSSQPGPGVSSQQSLGVAGDLPTPAWWSGVCDLTNYKKAIGINSYPMSADAIFHNVQACGPRPYSDNVPDVLVRFFSGAHGEYEWECVELSMRYLYLAHRVNPYPGNGKDVVHNYSIYNPNGELVEINNDTIGVSPVPGDVISYGTSGWGHTSVVKASNVNSSGNGTVTVLEQNSSATGLKDLTVTGWHVYASTLVTGWLHDPYQITDIQLSNKTLAENLAPGTIVGTLTATDQNTNAAHTYSLVSGQGSDENMFFEIQGNVLKTATILNYEVLKSYRIRVRVSNNTYDTFDKNFVITVTDTNDPPTGLNLSNSSVKENQPFGTALGDITPVDEDATDTYTYTLVSGTGGADNAAFNITNNTLKTSAIFDAETRNVYNIRVRVMDHAGLVFDKPFQINIENVSEYPPSDIQMSGSSLAENQASGVAVASLIAMDSDSQETFTYSLVSGTGSDDNTSFSITGSNLKAAETFDFETKASYKIRLRVTDSINLTFEKAFTLTITDVNDPPTNIALSPATLAENQSAGTTVGSLSAADQDSNDPHTYALVTGTDSDQNSYFSISGSTLKTAAILDYEILRTYKIRIRTTDSGGKMYEKAFSITVTDANDAPTNISLSKSSIKEQQPSGTLIGAFTTTDQDAGDTHTYAFVTGAGSTDNASFSIEGSELKATTAYDYEIKSSFSIRVQTTDSKGSHFDKQFTIQVTPTNEFAPTNVTLAPAAILENKPAGTQVGTLTTADLDTGDNQTYSLVSGTGSTNNILFTISADKLLTSASFDFESQSAYSIRIRTTDSGGLFFEKELVITIIDANDAPSGMDLDNHLLDENKLSLIGNFTSIDQDSGDSHTYALVSGSGSDDNVAFKIQGSQLWNTVAFDYETRSSLTILVKTIDGAGASFQKAFTINVGPVSEYPPTDILLDNAKIYENQPLDTLIGRFGSIDADLGENFTYSLVDGEGSEDNALFTVNGGALFSSSVFDYGLTKNYSIRVRSTDSGGKQTEKVFVIAILDRYESWMPLYMIGLP